MKMIMRSKKSVRNSKIDFFLWFQIGKQNKNLFFCCYITTSSDTVLSAFVFYKFYAHQRASIRETLKLRYQDQTSFG